MVFVIMLEVQKSSICDLSAFQLDEGGQGSLDLGFEAQAKSSLLKSHEINNLSAALEKVVTEFVNVSIC